MAVDEMMNPAMDEDESLEQLEALVIDINLKFHLVLIREVMMKTDG